MNLFPIKAHYFLFMAAMGPILPQINVIGKQLGISPDVMGLITSILPILYVLAKPAIGFVVDYFWNSKKKIFAFIIIIMASCYTGFAFIPQPIKHTINLMNKWNFTLERNNLSVCRQEITSLESLCTDTRVLTCYNNSVKIDHPLYAMKFDSNNQALAKIYPDAIKIDNASYHMCVIEADNLENYSNDIQLIACTVDKLLTPDCLYNSITFWLFVACMCLGTIGFNVTNCISDAICFDMLGPDNQMAYGNQRVWGTIGFGLAALISGITVNMSGDNNQNQIIPAVLIMNAFCLFDLISITKLRLPEFTSSESILHEVGGLLRKPNIMIFLVFATIAGIIDSFIIYFMFWFLEEVAEATNYMESIKLIEGMVVAAECLGGEIIFFLISGWILKRIGYIHCLSLCFFTYALRLGLISLITNPWWLVPIELVMQGSTYALTYTCIVAYAAAIAPVGASATVQGLVAGMDDGAGFAIGSLIGGQLYKYYGGANTFRIFACISLLACVMHVIVRPASKNSITESKMKYISPPEQNNPETEIEIQSDRIPQSEST